MSNFKVISFDVEGTIVTPYFSQVIWHEAIPALYAKRAGISFSEAKAKVNSEYDRVGDQQREWYDIGYWFNLFRLGDYHSLLDAHKHKISYYPEIKEVFLNLARNYQLIIVSNSAREFLDFMLEGINGQFAQVFSAISDYGQLKTSDFYRRVCKIMEIGSGEIVHVGDSWDFDFLFPKQAGIKAFYLDRAGSRKGNEVVENLKEFAAKILSFDGGGQD